MAWKDIRETLTDYPLAGGEPEGLYDSINLMCDLLDGIPYSEVYGDLHGFLQKVKQNVKAHLPTYSPQHAPLLQSIGKMHAHLASKPMELRLLFQERIDQSHDQRTVVNEFRNLHGNSGANLDILCLPFLRIQSGMVPVVKPQDMDKHIQGVGAYTLRDLFTLAKKDHPELVAAIKFARHINVFGPPGEGWACSSEEAKGSDNNRRTCDPNTLTCVEVGYGWCNTDANGNCTVVST